MRYLLEVRNGVKWNVLLMYIVLPHQPICPQIHCLGIPTMFSNSFTICFELFCVSTSCHTCGYTLTPTIVLFFSFTIISLPLCQPINNKKCTDALTDTDPTNITSILPSSTKLIVLGT